MRRISVIIVCLAILSSLCVFSFALADGGLVLNETDGHATLSEWVNTEGMDIYLTDWLGNIWIEDPDQFRTNHAGDPSWSVEMVEGNTGDAGDGAWNWNIWDDQNGLDLNINYEAYRPVAGDRWVFSIECEWDGEVANATRTFDFTAMPELPSGHTIPDTVHLKIEEEKVIPLNFVPADFAIDGQMQVDIWFYKDFNRDNRCEGYTQYITAYEAGRFAGYLGVHTGNVCSGRDVIFEVEDANGNVPGEAPSLNLELFTRFDQASLTNAITDEPAVYDSWNATFMLSEETYDAMHGWYGGEPYYEITESSGLDAWLEESWVDGRKRIVPLRIGGMPETEGNYPVTVRCTWGDLSAETELPIRYVRTEGYPDGCNIPYVIDLKVGETATFDWHFNNGYAFQEEYWFPVSLDDADFNELFELTNDGTQVTITPKVTESGMWYGNIGMMDGNVGCGHTVAFRVADANGDAPEIPGIVFDDENASGGIDLYFFRKAYEENPDEGTYHFDNFAGNVLIQGENYETLRRIYGEPEWSAQLLDEDLGIAYDAGIWGGGDNRGYDLRVHQIPDHACDARFDVTVSFGGLSRTVRVDAHFIDDELPSGFTADDVYTLNVDQWQDIPLGVGAGYEEILNGSQLGVALEMYGDDFYSHFDGWNERSVEHVYPREPGAYYLWMGLRLGNVTIGKDVIFLVRDWEGNLPDGNTFAFEDEECYEYTARRAAFTDEGEVSHNGWVRNYVIRDYAALAAQREGQPSWHAEFIGDSHGAQLWTNNWDWEGSYGVRAFDVGIENEPTEPCTISYKVTCTWGSETLEAVATLHYETPDSLPEGLDLPDEIHGMKINEVYALEVNPIGGYSFGENNRIDIGMNFDCGCWWEWTEDGRRVQNLEPHESGVFTVDLSLVLENINIHKQLRVYVQDEEGNEPELPVLAFDDDLGESYSLDFAIFDDQDGVWHDNWIDSYSICDYDALQRTYGNEPEWNAEWAEAYEDVSNIHFETYDGQRWAHLWLDDYPQEPCSRSVRVTVNWGDQSISRVVTVQYRYPDSLPTGLNAPDTVDLYLGEDTEITVNYEPSDFSFGGRIRTNVGLHNQDMSQYIDSWGDWYSDKVYLRGKEPGYYYGWINRMDGSICAGKDVVFIVHNEDGSLPGVPALAWEDEASYDYTIDFALFEDKELAENTVIQHDGWVRNYVLPTDIFNAYRAKFGGEPEWSAAWLENDGSAELDSYVWDDTRGFDVNITGYPETAASSLISVKCTWGGQTVTGQARVNFEKNVALPTGMNTPEVIDLDPGEEYAFTMGDVLPEGYAYSRQRINIGLHGDNDINNAFELWDDYNQSCGDHVQYIRSWNPGVYMAWIQYVEGNISIQRNVMLRVRDGEGNTPELPALAFDDDLGESYSLDFALFDDQDGVWHDNWIDSYWIRDYDELRRIYGNEPEWNVEWAEDYEGVSNIHFETYDGQRWAHLWLDDYPQEPCSRSVRVTVNWGDQSISRVVTVQYRYPDSLPTGLNAPDTVDLYLGEDTEITVNYEPSDFSFGGRIRTNVGLHNQDMSQYIDSWGDWYSDKVYLRGKEPGYYYGWINRMDGSICAGKDVVFIVHNEDGSLPGIPALEWEDAAMSDDTVHFALFDDEELGDGTVLGHDNWVRNFVIPMEIYDAYRAAYGGQPQWEYTKLSGSDSAVFNDWIWDDGRGYDLNVGQYPDAPCTVQYQVKCTWGDAELLGKVSVIFENIGALPTGMATPLNVSLQVNEEYAFTMEDVLPQGYDYGRTRINIGLVNGEDLNAHFDSRGDYDDNGNQLSQTIRPREAGVWAGWINYIFGNISLGRDVILSVADENGYVPEQTLELYGGPYFDEYVIIDCIWDGTDATALHPEDFMGNVFMDRNFYDVQWGLTHTLPEWSVEQTSGDTLEWYMDGFEDNGDTRSWQGVNIRLSCMPDHPMTATFTATCRWNGYEASFDLPVRFVEHDLPTGFTTDSRVELTAGVPGEVHYTIEPADWTYTDNRHFDIWLDTENTDYRCYMENGKLYAVIDQPGTYVGWFCLRDGSVNYLYQPVVFSVADENGNAPELVPILEDVYDVEMASSVTNTEGKDYWISHSDVMFIWPNNLNTLQTVYGDDWSWTFEKLSGPDAAVKIDTLTEYGFDLVVDNLEDMPAGSDASFRATLRWGESSASCTINLHFVEMELPDVTFPTVIEMNVNEPYYCSVNATPGDFSSSYFLHFDFFDEAWQNIEFYSHDDTPMDGRFLLANAPGIYYGNSHIHAHNVFLNGPNVTFKVKDGSGNLPDPVPFFADDSYSIRRYVLPSGEGDYEGMIAPRPNTLIGVCIDNADLMKETYGDTGEYSVEYISGPAVSPQIAQPEGDSPYAVISIPDLPQETGETLLRITCTRGGNSDSVDVYVQFENWTDDLPQGNDLPSGIVLKVGESMELTGGLTPASEKMPAVWTYLDMDESQDLISVEEVNDLTIRITGLKAGTLHAKGMVMTYWNVVAQKPVVITVVDTYTTMNLPDAVREIEEEAFAGVSANIVVVPDGCTTIGKRAFADCSGLVSITIPASVTSIADDAFEGCGSALTIISESEAIRTWAADHGFHASER